MAAKHATNCAVCGTLLGHLWLARRHRIPDYTCQDCFAAWECDAEGNIIPHAEQPAWLRALKNLEAIRRQRKRYWESRGYQYDLLTFSDLITTRGPEDDVLNGPDEFLAEIVVARLGGKVI